jgi:D-psicose/D-tagatose/L-ribulose 3-epimerase
MKIGMSLLLWTTDPLDEMWLPLYERLKAVGFDGLELPIYGGDPKKFEALGRRLDDLGLARTAGTARMAQDNPISGDSRVRAAAVAKTKAALECCQAGGMTHLAGPFYAALGVFSGKPPSPDEWRWGVESMRPVAEYAEVCGVTLALEFLNRFETYLLNSATDAVRFARAVGHPRCKIMYDTFHAHIEEKSVKAALEAAAPELAYVHISESDRSTPGTGQVRWSETFGALRRQGYDGWLTIEAFGQSLPELLAATKVWRRLYGDEEQLARAGYEFIRHMWAAAGPAGTG